MFLQIANQPINLTIIITIIGNSHLKPMETKTQKYISLYKRIK
jgi:hypothetical protein